MPKHTLYCRFCGELKAKDVIHELRRNKKKYHETIMKLSFVNAANLQLNENELLPKTICFNCDVSLTNAYEFIKSVNVAQEVLTDLFKDCDANVLKRDDLKCENLPSRAYKCPSVESNDDVKLESEVKPENFDVSPSFNDENDVIDNEIKEECLDSTDYPETTELTSCQVEFDLAKDELTSNLTSCDVKVDLEPELCSWNSYIWICSHCSLQFNSMNDLREHSKEKHKQCLAYSCLDCNTKITCFQMLLRHFRKHRKYLIDNCPYCFKRIPGGTEKKHMKTHMKGPQVACPTCGEIVNGPKELEDHTFLYGRVIRKRRKVGSPITVDELTCKTCHKVFKTLDSRRFHERQAHDKDRKPSFACDRCGKMFLSKGALKSHINVHDNNKPHVCQICNKSFLFPNMLRNHVESHSGIKKYKCEICDRAFRLERQLKTHKIIHTDIMPYMCQFCSKSFRFSSVLRTHERLHTGLKLYSCEVCSMTFNNWSNYNKHMVRRHGTSKAKRKRTAQGLFPIDPETGKVVEMTDSIEEWKAQVLAKTNTLDKRKKKVDSVKPEASESVLIYY